MKVTAHLTTGSVTIHSMPDENVMALLEWFSGEGSGAARFSLDSSAVTHIARKHIVRIDVDEED